MSLDFIAIPQTIIFITYKISKYILLTNLNIVNMPYILFNYTRAIWKNKNTLYKSKVEQVSVCVRS